MSSSRVSERVYRQRFSFQGPDHGFGMARAGAAKFELTRKEAGAEALAKAGAEETRAAEKAASDENPSRPRVALSTLQL